jgi:hypothetical protein
MERTSAADMLQSLDINPQVPRARLVRNGQTVQVSREQEQVIVKAIGQERRARLGQIINGGRFARLPEDTKRRLIEDGRGVGGRRAADPRERRRVMA